MPNAAVLLVFVVNIIHLSVGKFTAERLQVWFVTMQMLIYIKCKIRVIG